MESDLGPVSRHVGDRLDFAVGHGVDGTIGVAQDRASQGHVLDGTLNTTDTYNIADVVLIFEEDEESVDDVFDECLRAKADRKAYHAGGSNEWLHVDVQYAKDLDHGAEQDHKHADAADDAGKSVQLLRTNTRGEGLTFAQYAETMGDH